MLAASTTPQHHHVEENEQDENDDELPNGDVSKELHTEDNIIDPVEDRRTLAERNERLHDQLKVITWVLSLIKIFYFILVLKILYWCNARNLQFAGQTNEDLCWNFRHEH